MAAIKERIGSKPIWFSVDETTDVKGRYIANFVLGAWMKMNQAMVI
jgi:hypothetical protein